MTRPFSAQNGAEMKHPNRLATNRTVRAMRAGGRLEPIDAAAIAAAQTTADLLDQAIVDGEMKGYEVAALGRLHLAALLALIGKEADDVDEGIAAVIAALSTPMGHTEN
jgi:hypothetical protein